MNSSSANAANDPFNLSRFVKAQQHVFDQAMMELKSGRKRSHWMWFIFPQIEGLAFSEMSKRICDQVC